MPTTRSQSRRSNLHQILEEEATVPINWLFFHSQDLHPRAQAIDVPQSLFNKRVQDCRKLFSEEILKERKLYPILESVTFWRPKEPLSIDTPDEEWKATITDLKSFARLIPMPRLLSTALKEDVANIELIHLIVTADQNQEATTTTIVKHNEAPDLVALPEYRRYRKMLLTKGRSPSAGATANQYSSVQNTEGETIHDGRYPPIAKWSTIAPPIQLFHPIFNTFLHLIENPEIQPTRDELKLTGDLMISLCRITKGEDGVGEEKRNEMIRNHLRKMVHTNIKVEPNTDKTVADGVLIVDIDGVRFPTLIIELKRELGEGGCDPSVQAGITMRRSWITDERERIRERCCCPTLMLAGGGPWLCVLGGVFTDKIVVQRLTDLKWVGVSSTEEDSRVYYNARIFVALRKSLEELTKFYEDRVTSMPALSPDQQHPRFFPYPTSFIEDGRICNFRYIGALDDDAACVTFRARIFDENAEKSEKPDIVVKFVSRYGEAAHRFLAQHGHAPALRYYGPLPDTPQHKDVLPPLAQNAVPGLCLRSDIMYMAVMEYIDIDIESKLTANARQEIRDILTKLHCEGYAFGDLREQNILIDRAGGVKLIDFNWCGPYDMEVIDKRLPNDIREKIGQIRKSGGKSDKPFAHYPLFLSPTIPWAEGVEALKPIRPEHDWCMFEKLPWK